jgi:hypothetical protein
VPREKRLVGTLRGDIFVDSMSSARNRSFESLLFAQSEYFAGTGNVKLWLCSASSKTSLSKVIAEMLLEKLGLLLVICCVVEFILSSAVSIYFLAISHFSTMNDRFIQWPRDAQFSDWKRGTQIHGSEPSVERSCELLTVYKCWRYSSSMI